VESGNPALGIRPARLNLPGAAHAGRPRLTRQAHAAWTARLRPGAWAVDATAGRGQDTARLACGVGSGGRVFAIDIQAPALQATAARLQQEGLADRVTLLHGDHARLLELLPSEARGRVALVCFNLGYLPGGDHRVTTRAASTLPALAAALELLEPAGALSVIAYRGHPGALEETAAVAAFFARLPPPWRCIEEISTGGGGRPGPVWWLAAGQIVTGT